MAILEFARVNGTRYELADKQSREALETKAEIDGYYEDMTVGDAEQLVSTKYVEDSEPYKYRTTGGSADVGNRAYLDKIVGGSMVWNQLARFDSGFVPSSRQGVTISSDDNKSVTLHTDSETTQSVTITGWFGMAQNRSLSDERIGHKILVFSTLISGQTSANVLLQFTSTLNPLRSNIAIGMPTILIVGGDSGATRTMSVYVQEGTLLTNYKFTLAAFDLTQMFGSAIADHIYSLEQANAGAGAALFRSWFPDSYYEYNAGELVSVEGLQTRKTVGFNLFDKSTAVDNKRIASNGNEVSDATAAHSDYIRVLPNMTYYTNADGASGYYTVCEFDGEKNFIGTNRSTVAGVFTTTENTRFVIVNTAKANVSVDQLVLNLSWSGTRNGEYAPYEEHEYPLDSSLTLRGIPKLVDGEVQWDGDEYTPDGKVKRRYGIVDMGTLTWRYNSREGHRYFFATLLNPKRTKDGATKANLVCDKYYNDTGNHVYANTTDKTVAIPGDNDMAMIYDSAYTDAASFKTAMSGVMLVYELATPTEEEAEPYTEVQIVDDWGTEEFVSDSIVPVGHETRYPANLRDKLQHLPDLASADGNYLIQQSGSQMSLVHFRIPQAPTEDGTYVLKATVSGGTPTYTWEVAE